MKHQKLSKWRRYLNIILGISTRKVRVVEYTATYEPSSGTISTTHNSDYRSSSERFMHARGREVYMATGRTGQPEIEYCGF